MISGVFKEAVPQTIEEKKAFMLKHNIALWDTIYSCDIIGSSDSSIKNVEPTDLKSIVDNSKIEKVICNGKISGKYYEKYQMKYLGLNQTFFHQQVLQMLHIHWGNLLRYGRSL